MLLRGIALRFDSVTYLVEHDSSQSLSSFNSNMEALHSVEIVTMFVA
jgi:hypothetical protein